MWIYTRLAHGERSVSLLPSPPSLQLTLRLPSCCGAASLTSLFPTGTSSCFLPSSSPSQLSPLLMIQAGCHLLQEVFLVPVKQPNPHSLQQPWIPIRVNVLPCPVGLRSRALMEFRFGLLATKNPALERQVLVGEGKLALFKSLATWGEVDSFSRTNS